MTVIVTVVEPVSAVPAAVFPKSLAWTVSESLPLKPAVGV